MPVKTKQKGGNPNNPVSFLNNSLQMTHSIANIFDHNFSKFLQLSLEKDAYMNVYNYDLTIVNDNNEPIEEYKNYVNPYDEDFNPEFETWFYSQDKHPVYNGVYQMIFKIVLPEHTTDSLNNNIAKKCFSKTTTELDKIFQKLMNSVIMRPNIEIIKILKSKNKFNIPEIRGDDEEYILFANNYLIHIIFSKYTYEPINNADIPLQYKLNVTATYIDLTVISEAFNFDTAKNLLFDKIDLSANQMWFVAYSRGRKQVETDVLSSKDSKFSNLDDNLTSQIFSMANNLTQYNNKQISTMVNIAIKKALTIRNVSRR
jgi:hypothetical protein